MYATYDYILEKCRTLIPTHGRALDFGCGAAACVMAGRSQGLDIVGVDIFSEDYHKKAVIDAQLLGSVVFEIVEDGPLPFGDAHFDFVFANVVFEHVRFLDKTLREIARVLKPGGRLLTIFPGKETVVERHVMIPFVHWFSKESRLRYPYMTQLRRLGLGGGRAGKTPAKWAEDQLSWMDRYTYYRSPGEINAAFEAAGFTKRHVEDDLVKFRLARRGWSRAARITALPPFAPVARAVYRTFGAQAILATKR